MDSGRWIGKQKFHQPPVWDLSYSHRATWTTATAFTNAAEDVIDYGFVETVRDQLYANVIGNLKGGRWTAGNR